MDQLLDYITAHLKCGMRQQDSTQTPYHDRALVFTCMSKHCTELV